MSRYRAEHFRALFDPAGVIVAGASSHPGKFGFAALHNLLAGGYRGRVFATNLEGGPVLGIDTVRHVSELPEGQADLVFVSTPAGANLELLKGCAARGVRAAFVFTGGYAEAGEEGRRAQDELVAVAAEGDMLLAGPNGQGVISTPTSLFAQVVAPYPPAGRIGIVSQSGNLTSSFMNLACHHGVGVSRAVSAGNAAATGVIDYLEFYAGDPHTAVALVYVEEVGDGREFAGRLRGVTERIPLVVVKGGATAGGAQAAASHTGSLASDDRVFDGVCRQVGAVRAATIEEGYEAAATFATQPLPTGPRVAVVTTAGGWGVVTADAVVRAPGLELAPLPGDLRAALDTLLPPRWSRSNPIDLAGGEGKDTVPRVLELVAGHPAVDAVVFLGLGIQGNQAKVEREGPFFPGHGLDRIVAYHERQERRYAETAGELAGRAGKPVLAATELAMGEPANPAVAGVRGTGKLCHLSGHRAVVALSHLWRYARWRQNRGLS